MASRFASAAREEIIQITVYTKELFTLPSAASGGYLPRRFGAGYISTTSHLHFGG